MESSYVNEPAAPLKGPVVLKSYVTSAALAAIGEPIKHNRAVNSARHRAVIVIMRDSLFCF
jgi:hypothetical protein